MVGDIELRSWVQSMLHRYIWFLLISVVPVFWNLNQRNSGFFPGKKSELKNLGFWLFSKPQRTCSFHILVLWLSENGGYEIRELPWQPTMGVWCHDWYSHNSHKKFWAWGIWKHILKMMIACFCQGWVLSLIQQNIDIVKNLCHYFEGCCYICMRINSRILCAWGWT